MPLPRKHRLATRSDFDKVFREGKVVKGSFLFIKSRTSEFGFPRFGFIVPKKIYSKAVDRNRLERVLSEIVARYIKSHVTNSRDFIVVISRQGQENLVKNELVNLLR